MITLGWLYASGRMRKRGQRDPGTCPECQIPLDMHHYPGCSRPCGACRMSKRRRRRQRAWTLVRRHWIWAYFSVLTILAVLAFMAAARYG